MDPDSTRVPGARDSRPDEGDATFVGPGIADHAVTQIPAQAGDVTIVGEHTSDVDRTVLPASLSQASAPGAARGTLLNGESFGPRYHIIRELGVGGMGAVYHAWDDELGVSVALKLIRPGAATADAARDLELRFKRELLLARQVTHKNVVRIHDLGELDGIKYITMPYVEGSDLSQVLEAEGKLPVDRTLAIARQVASGLRAAHDVGIVHRDLKPANIMIEGETALIMDFGIARSVTQAPDVAAVGVKPVAQRPPTPQRPGTTPRPGGKLNPGDSSLTMVGGVVGTMQYMAPEQARAEPVDHRADIYAFGLIIYDLLLGRRRHAKHDSAVNELMARIKEPPPPAATIDAAIPVPLDAVIQRCLAPDPADRFPTTADLVAALDRLDDQGNLIPELPQVQPWSKRAIAGMVLAGTIVLGGTFWVARQNATPAIAPPPVSVLVADFVNSTNDPVFTGLIEQAFTVGLEGASFVTAYPRGNALQMASQITESRALDGATATLVALREGVGRIITGSIESAAGGYRITATLIEPNESKVLQTWSEDADNRDAVLAAVGTLAVNVRAGLGDANAGASEPGADESFTAASLDAARAYATGQELQWAGNAEQAMAEYHKAVQLDPNLGRAYSGLGALADSLGRKQEAEGYYKQALTLIARMTDREKFRTRGGYYLLTRNADKALDEFQALVDKYPADTAGLANLALAYFYRRDMARAVEVGRRAVDIYPKNVIRRNNLALFAMYAGDFATAETEANEVLKLNPSREKAFVALAMAQASLGRPEEAGATYTKLQEVSDNGRAMASNGLADLALLSGRLSAASKLLEAAIKSEKDASRQTRFMVSLAEVRLAQARPRDAAALATQALGRSSDPAVRLLAGLVLAQSGQSAAAEQLAATLDQRLDAESQVSGRILAGEIALQRNEPRTAIERFKAAQQVTDTWLGRYGLGRAYLMGEAYAEADSEFDACMARRGEATAVLLDDVPTVRLIAPLYYYQGRAREGLGSPGAQESYQQFLAIKEGGDEQGLVADARRRSTRP